VARFCRNCGANLPVRGGDAELAGFDGGTMTRTMAYGGFWIRLVAAIIDGILLGIVGGIVGAFLGSGTSAQGISSLLGVVIGWLYDAYMTSSERQATLGKMALGLKVTNAEGNRLSFGKATGRHFAKYLSAIILMIGYIMAAFDSQKRALHDRIVGTLVVKANR
jgi:uncharacterized RDD family membrane protein YckC